MSDPARNAESVRCSDCSKSLQRYGAYEVRGPQEIADGVSSTNTFWVCPTCWDRFVSRAVLSAMRGF